MRVRRYWFRFDISMGDPHSAGLLLGCGVTAFGVEDALQMVRERIFKGDPLPRIVRIIDDVDVSTLDEGHVLPNMGVPVWRGIWFPRGFD